MEKLIGPLDREKVELVMSPLWLNIGPCPPECDKKDLMHAVGVTNGGLQRSKVLGMFCRIRIMVDVRKPLRRGIFVSTSDSGKTWLAFKYENLLVFCYGCRRMGHGVMDCGVLSREDKLKGEDLFPYSVALRAKSKLLGKEYLQFGLASKLSTIQRNYIGLVSTVRGEKDSAISSIFLVNNRERKSGVLEEGEKSNMESVAGNMGENFASGSAGVKINAKKFGERMDMDSVLTNKEVGDNRRKEIMNLKEDHKINAARWKRLSREFKNIPLTEFTYSGKENCLH